MRILIGEDDILIAEHLSDIVRSFGHEMVGMGHSKSEILSLIKRTDPDLILLDIRMEEAYDGIEIGEYIQQNYNFPVIFLTAHSDQEIVSRALKTKPSGYIIKPFKPMDIFTAIHIAMDKFRGTRNENFILVKDGYHTIKLFLFDILYVKSDNNYIEIYTKERKFVERLSLENFCENIGSTDFLRVHRSYLINLNYATELKTQSVVVHGIEIPVSRKYQNELRGRFQKNT